MAIKWEFIPPCSPWFGGFYERLVKSVKVPLRKVLGKSTLWLKELMTIVTEIERLVNDRPLTHVGDFDDAPPLTPA